MSISNDISKALMSALKLGQGVKQEIEPFVAQHIKSVLQDFNLVTREEYDQLQEQILKLTQEQNQIQKRLDILETQND